MKQKMFSDTQKSEASMERHNQELDVVIQLLENGSGPPQERESVRTDGVGSI